MQKKLILFGIDGLEPSLVNAFVTQKKLKTFSSPSFSVKLRSTFPPDSYLAWPSIFTGQNLTAFIHDIIADDLSPSRLGYYVRDRIAGNTFWDKVGSHRYRVCVINPFLGFPPWKVNGLMISGPVGIENGIPISFPEWVTRRYNVPRMGGILEGFSLLPWEYGAFYRNCCYETKEMSRLTAEVIKDGDFDLVFVTYLTLDRIEHSFWRFADLNDPDKSLLNIYRDSLANFYILLDKTIEIFLKKFGNEYTIAAFGDHGHGPRPYYLLALNELLRRMKMLDVGQERIFRKLKELVTVMAFQILYTSGLDSFAYRICRKLLGSVRFRHKNFSRISGISTSPLFGFKQYGALKMAGGSCREKESYEDVISLLHSYGLLEQTYAGEKESAFSEVSPCAVFKLDDRIGLYHRLYAPLIMKNFTRKLISGGHKDITAMYVWNSNGKLRQSKCSGSIIEIFSSILEFFGLRTIQDSHLWHFYD